MLILESECLITYHLKFHVELIIYFKEKFSYFKIVSKKKYVNKRYVLSLLRKDFLTLLRLHYNPHTLNIPKLDYKRIEPFPVLL